MSKNVTRIVAILIILGLNVGCDQISKNMVRKQIRYNEQINLLDTYVTLTKIENTGAFLSLGNSYPKPVKILLMIIIPLVLLGAGTIFMLIKSNLSRITTLGMCFIVGGGVGNIYDRIVYGSVTDFLHIDFVLFQTGIFNLADLSVMIGVCLFLLEFFLQSRNQKLHVEYKEDSSTS